MKNKIITAGLMLSFFFFLPFSSQVNAESFGDLYNQKERVASLKETATYLLSVVEDDEDRENIKIALQQIINTANNIEERVQQKIEDDFSAENETLESFKNMGNLESFITEGDLYFETDYYIEEAVEGFIKAEWEVVIEKSGNIEVNLDLDLFLEEINLNETIHILLSGKIAYVNEKLFGKLDEFYLSTNMEDIFMLIFIDMAEDLVSEIRGEYVLLSENLNEDIEREMPDDDYYSLKSFVEDENEILLNLFKYNVFEIEKTERERVDGKYNNKYTITINKENLDEFNDAMLKEYGYGGMNIEEGINISIEIWSDGDYITKAKISISADNNEGKISLILNLYFSNFNESFNITAPRNYIDIEDL
jgi:hypothetical protein